MAQTEAPATDTSRSGPLYVCEECREPLSEDATVCPHCGYEPSAEINKQASWRIGVGAVLCLLVVGAPLGIPLIYSGYKHGKTADDVTPAVSA